MHCCDPPRQQRHYVARLRLFIQPLGMTPGADRSDVQRDLTISQSRGERVVHGFRNPCRIGARRKLQEHAKIQFGVNDRLADVEHTRTMRCQELEHGRRDVSAINTTEVNKQNR